MSLFEYIAVIVAVIIGLGVTWILQGVGGLLEARARVRLYWVHLVFTGIILLGHLQFWWLFWSSRQVQAWCFFPFLFLLLQPIILYLISSLCFPDISATGKIDLKDFYYGNHRWFFGLLALLMLLIILRDILFRTVPWISQGNAVTVGVLPIGVVGALSRKPWIHAILALLAATAMLIALFTFGLKDRFWLEVRSACRRGFAFARYTAEVIRLMPCE
jgi:hypothetical protein